MPCPHQGIVYTVPAHTVCTQTLFRIVLGLTNYEYFLFFVIYAQILPFTLYIQNEKSELLALLKTLLLKCWSQILTFFIYLTFPEKLLRFEPDSFKG